MPNIGIPPWLTAAPDYASTYLRGVQVGASIGAQQAQQVQHQQSLMMQARLAEMDDARQEQAMALQQARWEAEMNLKASETARRVQARRQFSDLVGQGVDPLQAMMQVPDVWEESPTALAQMYRVAQQEKAIESFVPRMKDIQGHQVLQTGPTSWQYIKSPTAATAEPVIDKTTGQVVPGTFMVGEHLLKTTDDQSEERRKKILEDRQIALLRTELARLNKIIGDYSMATQGPLKATADRARAQKNVILQKLSELTDLDEGTLDESVGPSVVGPETAMPTAVVPPGISIRRIK